jgi:hypothetical protein
VTFLTNKLACWGGTRREAELRHVVFVVVVLESTQLELVVFESAQLQFVVEPAQFELVVELA